MISTTAIRRALYGKLAGDSTLTDQLAAAPSGWSQSIYYRVAPPEASVPFVVFSKQSGRPMMAMADNEAIGSQVWLVKAVDLSDTADTVESVASRLDALLTDGALSISGASQLWLRRESDVDFEETDGDDRYQHAGIIVRLDYE